MPHLRDARGGDDSSPTLGAVLLASCQRSPRALDEEGDGFAEEAEAPAPQQTSCRGAGGDGKPSDLGRPRVEHGDEVGAEPSRLDLTDPLAHADGLAHTYTHQPMLAWWRGRFYLEYLSAPRNEHDDGTVTSLTTSPDGVVLR